MRKNLAYYNHCQERIIYQNILWLYIPMANPRHWMDIGQPPKNLIKHVSLTIRVGSTKKGKKEQIQDIIIYLICIKFDIYERHPLVSIAIMLQDLVHSLRNIFHYQIQKKFISACCGKEAVLQGDHIWVIHQAQQLQLTIFIPPVL